MGAARQAELHDRGRRTWCSTRWQHKSHGHMRKTNVAAELRHRPPNRHHVVAMLSKTPVFPPSWSAFSTASGAHGKAGARYLRLAAFYRLAADCWPPITGRRLLATHCESPCTGQHFWHTLGVSYCWPPSAGRLALAAHSRRHAASGKPLAMHCWLPARLLPAAH